MSPDEWLGIVHWLAENDVRWTVDIATKYGVRLKGYDADRVRQAMTYLLDQGTSITDQRVLAQLRRPSSKYAKVLEESHRRVFPIGCRNRNCDLCVDNAAAVRHNV